MNIHQLTQAEARFILGHPNEDQAMDRLMHDMIEQSIESNDAAKHDALQQERNAAPQFRLPPLDADYDAAARDAEYPANQEFEDGLCETDSDHGSRLHWSESDARKAGDVAERTCIHGVSMNVFCGRCEA